MDTVIIIGRMEEHIKDNGKIIRCMGMESLYGQMEENMRER